MIEGKLSRRYAKALFQLAVEERKVEEIGQELERFASVYASVHLSSVLNNPAFEVETRKRIAAQIANELRLSPLTIHFLSLLIDRHRLVSLPSIVFHFRRLQDEALGRIKARVAAASPLGSEVMDKLGVALEKISGKKVVLGEEIDPKILGGLVIHMEGKVYDGSLRAQLEKMRKQIEEGY